MVKPNKSRHSLYGVFVFPNKVVIKKIPVLECSVLQRHLMYNNQSTLVCILAKHVGCYNTTTSTNKVIILRHFSKVTDNFKQQVTPTYYMPIYHLHNLRVCACARTRVCVCVRACLCARARVCYIYAVVYSKLYLG